MELAPAGVLASCGVDKIAEVLPKEATSKILVRINFKSWKSEMIGLEFDAQVGGPGRSKGGETPLSAGG